MPSTEAYLMLSGTLFAIGLVGVIIRRNMITVLMAIELMLNAVNLNLVAFSHRMANLEGQIFTIFIITVAAGEAAVGLGVFILLVTIVRPGVYHDERANKAPLTTVKERELGPSRKHPGQLAWHTVRRGNANSEAVGMALYRDYLVPFEVASLFLLVAMIGAIVIGKRELSALEEETAPRYMLDRVETEKAVKGAQS